MFMKKIIASLLICFISPFFYSQTIFDLDYHKSQKKEEEKSIEELMEEDDGTEYDYAKENGIAQEDEKLIEEIERQSNLLEGNFNELKYFSDAIEENVRLYTVNSQVANEKQDLERSRFLYDSLVNYCLKGTHFDNFLVTKTNGNLMYFENFTKPIYLKTTSVWCEPNESESTAFNDVANEFSDLIDFVVLYWDTKERVNQVENRYNSNVTVLYVDETENYNSAIVKAVKHSLGLPTIIMMDQERTVIDVRRVATPVYVPPPNEGIVKHGTFNPGDHKDHFVNSYGDYFDKLVLDVNTIISKM